MNRAWVCAVWVCAVALDMGCLERVQPPVSSGRFNVVTVQQSLIGDQCNVTKGMASISGEGMTTIEQEMAVTGDDATAEFPLIPIGSSRLIQVTLFDGNDKPVYLGERSIDVPIGDPITATVPLYQNNEYCPLVEDVTIIGEIRPYVDLYDGTVYDLSTGLIWKKCVQGYTYDAADNSCTVSGETVYQWCISNSGACDDGTVLTGPNSGVFTTCHELNLNGGFAGYTDWRVPILEEVKSLVYCTNGPPDVEGNCTDQNGPFDTPVVDQFVFPHNGSSLYWTASLVSGSAVTHAHIVSFSNGSQTGMYKSYASGRVRCVR